MNDQQDWEEKNLKIPVTGKIKERKRVLKELRIFEHWTDVIICSLIHFSLLSFQFRTLKSRFQPELLRLYRFSLILLLHGTRFQGKESYIDELANKLTLYKLFIITLKKVNSV